MAGTVLRLTAVFEGRVQGVGFRWQTLRVARGFEVAGTVQNLPDGTVRLVAEGVPAEVRAFAGAVRDEMRSFVKKATLSEEEGVPAVFRDFKII